MSIPVSSKPVILYDHLPGILAGYPAVLFALLALFSLPNEFYEKSLSQPAIADVAESDAEEATAATSEDVKPETEGEAATQSTADANRPWYVPNPHMLFWVALSVMLVWYVAFRFNLPKGKFILMFGLIGTFVGIPVILEVFDVVGVFSWTGRMLGSLAPEMNAGAFFVLSLVFFIIWISNLVYSRTHMKVIIDESGLTINRLGGKGERFELIGLKTENEPLDYLELFLAGIGSLSLKTRMDREIFKMDRVVGLYRIPFFPFFKGKLECIEEILSYQGKVVSVDSQDAAEAADQMGAESEEAAAAGGEEFGGHDGAGSDSGGIR